LLTNGPDENTCALTKQNELEVGMQDGRFEDEEKVHGGEGSV